MEHLLRMWCAANVCIQRFKGLPDVLDPPRTREHLIVVARKQGTLECVPIPQNTVRTHDIEQQHDIINLACLARTDTDAS